MEPPPVRYVTTSDGYRIAYTVCGQGQPLVFMPIAFSHVQLSWGHLTWLDALAEHFRLVHFDARGQGMSRRGLPPDFALSDWERDLAAVLDANGDQPAVLLGLGHFAHVAVRYALENPERIAALVLNTCSITMASWPQSLWKDVARENWDLFLSSIVSLTLAPAQREQRLRNMRDSCTQADWLVLSKVGSLSSLEGIVEKVETPTLVMHPRQTLMLSAEVSSELAGRLPNANLVLLDGNDPYGDPHQGVSAIKDFLASLPISQAASALSFAGALSSREMEVLRLIAEGKSNRQIAAALVISPNTVGRHVANIFSKIGVANRAEATSYAHRNRLI